MAPEEQKRLEDMCTIKSQKMFIDTCRKNGIPDDWYAFYKDYSKVVYSEGTFVNPDTECAIRMQVWDVMFEKLIRHKFLYDWEHSDENLKIYNISVHCDVVTAYVCQDKPFPYVTVRKRISGSPDDMPAEELDGWRRDGYDPYFADYLYTKEVDIRSYLQHILVRFRKRTDVRDRRTFGFSDVSMLGHYIYPTPTERMDEIAHEVYDSLVKEKYPVVLVEKELSRSIVEKMMPFLTANLIEDEYRALCDLKRNPEDVKNPVYGGSLGERGFYVSKGPWI